MMIFICFKLQPEVKADVKRKEACTRIRLKIFPYFLKARDSGNAVPYNILVSTGPGCSKLTTSLVNVSLKFQTLISQICQYFLLKKCEKLLQCKSFSHFFNKKYQCIWL